KGKFKPVDPHPNFPEIEEEVLTYWQKERIFEKSLERNKDGKKWNFLDGPPFITGLPHYGSLLSSIPKDVFPRYKTMNGFYVRRVWGWDCHGLPAENKVEEKLGIKRKKDIEEKVGVKKFIDECKLYVNQVSSEWEWYVDHVGRWVDFKNAYRTMDMPYMESVMWVFKQMYEKGYIYKGLRVSLYCPHCATPISNFEVAMDADNYKEVTEPANIYKYRFQGERDTYFLAWSTTPWNKIATPALAVNPKLKYVKVAQGSEKYILAKATLKILKKHPKYKILEEFTGVKLVGNKFVSHYDFYKADSGKKAFVVIPGDFVTSEEGTGIVTIAAYGEDDLAVMQKENIQIVLHVDEEGILKKGVPWEGQYYLDTNQLVNHDLKSRGLMYSEDQYTHTVPTCWRCNTRLYYAPQNAWYVDVQSLKEKLKETNKKVNWYPAHFKYGRYLKSLENAPDWCISRSRYWGSPVPVWECECGEKIVPGSIKNLEELSGQKINDLHKPGIDKVTIKCPKCGKVAKRVPEVLDSWIEAGSAPYAERHFPFKKNLDLKEFFPPDFITEYTGQIRAWFYVLHVIATAIYEKEAFKNVLVSGVILGTDGRKMSKNYNNYPDPKEMLQKYGGDALRLYLLRSPVMRGEDILISEEKYREQVRGLLLILWNIYNFFITYANIDSWSPSNKSFLPKNILDEWILSRLEGNIRNMVQKGYDKFDTPEIIGQFALLMQDLSLWYVRRSRERVGLTAKDKNDRDDCYQTLWIILKEYSKALAPIVPFTSEEIYRNLTSEVSVHLADWPRLPKEWGENPIERPMLEAMKIASKIHAYRKEASVKVRIPFKLLSYLVLDETNVYKLVYKGKSKEIMIIGDKSQKNQDIQAGQARELIRQIQIARKEAGCDLAEKVTVTLPTWPKEFEQEIKKQTLAEELVKGEKLTIKRAG
ncbi:MAG: Isoleucine-tRNA ligase, partial [Candidatus Curtissbacteria bacterium GW2011_GWA1_40_24]